MQLGERSEMLLHKDNSYRDTKIVEGGIKIERFFRKMMDLNEKEAAGIDEFVTEKSLISPVITAQNLCSINSCPDQQMYRARILFLFQLDAYVQDENGETDPAALEALIDLVHDAILFAADNQLPYAKSIVFLTIFIVVIQQAIVDPYYEPERLYKRYERFLLIHSIDRPPFSSAIFELPDVKIINEYFVTHIFRNLKLIINCLTAKPTLSFKTLSSVQIKVPELPPLSEMEIELQEQLSSHQGSSSRAEESKSLSGRGQEEAQASAQARALHEPSPRQIARQSSKDVIVSSRSGLQENEDKGPEVPLDILKNSLSTMHQKFVSDFDEKERQLIGKIKELEIRMGERPPLSGKKPATKQSKK